MISPVHGRIGMLDLEPGVGQVHFQDVGDVQIVFDDQNARGGHIFIIRLNPI